jgi:hypothetical protein
MISPFSQYLAEVFEQPYPLRVLKTSGGGNNATDIIYTAKTDGGDLIEIEFSQWGGKERWRIDFSVNKTVQMTGAGKPWRILATVLQAIRQFMEWHKKNVGTDKDPYPQVFVVSASGISRYKAYTAMIRRFAHTYGYRIGSIFDDSDLDETNITLERR